MRLEYDNLGYEIAAATAWLRNDKRRFCMPSPLRTARGLCRSGMTTGEGREPEDAGVYSGFPRLRPDNRGNGFPRIVLPRRSAGGNGRGPGLHNKGYEYLERKAANGVTHATPGATIY
jgi:hypothetical protein